MLFCVSVAGCPILASPMEGKTIVLEPRFLPLFSDKVYDCVWQLKIPQELHKVPNVHAFLRILDLKMEGVYFLNFYKRF